MQFLERPFKFVVLWGRPAAWESKLAQDQCASHLRAIILNKQPEKTVETLFSAGYNNLEYILVDLSKLLIVVLESQLYCRKTVFGSL